MSTIGRRKALLTICSCILAQHFNIVGSLAQVAESLSIDTLPPLVGALSLLPASASFDTNSAEHIRCADDLYGQLTMIALCAFRIEVGNHAHDKFAVAFAMEGRAS